jgi:hypothetical protein
MKSLLILLGIAAGFATPLSAQANPESSRTSAGRTGQHHVQASNGSAAARNLSDQRQCIYYITAYTPTGSHIPAVFCRYQGRYFAMGSTTSRSVYTASDIGLTGALSVGGALRTLDPAISSAGGFR